MTILFLPIRSPKSDPNRLKRIPAPNAMLIVKLAAVGDSARVLVRYPSIKGPVISKPGTAVM